jgi:hypothetical protein
MTKVSVSALCALLVISSVAAEISEEPTHQYLDDDEQKYVAGKLMEDADGNDDGTLSFDELVNFKMGHHLQHTDMKLAHVPDAANEVRIFGCRSCTKPCSNVVSFFCRKLSN